MTQSNVSNALVEKLGTLRAVIGDNDRPLEERRDAAAYLVRTLVEAVPVPGADDPEVVKLQQPWHDPWLAEIAKEATGGRSITGHSLKEASEEVHKRLRKRVVLSVVVNEGLSRLERLAACQYVLDDAHPKGVWRINSYSPETLLDKIEVRSRCRPSGGFEYYKADPPEGARPPVELSDVWNM